MNIKVYPERMPLNTKVRVYLSKNGFSLKKKPLKKYQLTNGKNQGVLVITLLIAAFFTPLFIACVDARSSGNGNYPEMPGGNPDNAVQYNKTDVTPIAEMTQVKAGEQTLFCYQNMTLLMNCTQNCVLVFTADPNVAPKVLGLFIDSNQPFVLTMNTYESPRLGEQLMERTLNFYLGLEPNTEIQLSAQLKLHINQTELCEELNREVNASRLKWMYWNKAQAHWIPVESYMDHNGYLVCNIEHLSTWTIAEFTDTTESTADTTQGGIPVLHVCIIVFLIVLVVIAVGAFVILKKHKYPEKIFRIR